MPRSYEIDKAERMLGGAFEHSPYRSGNNIKTDLGCYRKSADLSAEVALCVEEKHVSQQEAAREVITKPRNCSEWYPYTEGLAPQQHLEQVKTAELEQARKRLEQELTEMGERFQQESKAISDAASAIVSANDSLARRVRLWIILLAILQLLIGSAAIYLSLRR
jgi:hypothetical protein